MNPDTLDIRDISILEDSKYFVNRSVDALNLQMRRLKHYTESGDDEFWDYVADVNFYIVALRRFRKAISVSLSIDELKPEMTNALRAFDDETKFTKKLRDIIEHIDAYVPNDPKRHHPEIKNANLYTIHFNNDSFCWAGFEFNVDVVHEAAGKLHVKYSEMVKREFQKYRRNRENQQNT
jgi:hypothetical protein